MKVLKFGASWCSGCMVMKPRFDEIEKENSWLKTEDLDADENKDLLEKHSVKDLPTFIYLDKDENELDRQNGIVPKGKIIEAINNCKDK